MDNQQQYHIEPTSKIEQRIFELESMVMGLARSNNDIIEQNQLLINELLKYRDYERNMEQVIVNAAMYFLGLSHLANGQTDRGGPNDTASTVQQLNNATTLRQ